MRYIHGKEVLESLEEIADPRHSALLIVDVQNDFCSPQGKAGRRGSDLSSTQEMIPHLKTLLEEARRHGALPVFIQMTVLPQGQSDSGAWIYRRLKIDPQDTDYCVDDTWGQEMVAELQPLPGEPMVKKHRSSAFHETNLNHILKNNGIKTVIVSGVVTQGCVESTVRDALFHDYYVLVPRDCVASSVRPYHEASLMIMASQADVVTSTDLFRVWAELRAPAKRA